MNLVNTINNIKKQIKKRKENKYRYGKKKPILTFGNASKKSEKQKIEKCYRQSLRNYNRTIKEMKKDMETVNQLCKNKTNPAMTKILLDGCIERLNKNQRELCSNIKEDLEKYSFLNRKKMPNNNVFYLWEIIDQDDRIYRIEDKSQTYTMNDNKTVIEEKNSIEEFQKTTLSIEAQKKKEREKEEETIENCKKEIQKVFKNANIENRKLKQEHKITEYKRSLEEIKKKYHLDMVRLLEMYKISECQEEWLELENNYKSLNLDSFYLALKQNIRTKYHIDQFEIYFAKINEIYQEHMHNLLKIYFIPQFKKKTEILKQEKKEEIRRINSKYGANVFAAAMNEIKEEVSSKKQEITSSKVKVKKC